MRDFFMDFIRTINESGPEKETLVYSLIFTLCMSGIMALTYRFVHTSLSYNSKFNINLMMMAFLSNVLLLLIRDNPLISLGALGSLSICRIRMNTKDPRDLGFVFWALSIGVTSAVGAYLPGIISTVILSFVLILMCKGFNRRKKCTLVIIGNKPQFASVQDVFRHLKGITVQSKNIYEESFELVYEMRVNSKIEEAVITKLNLIDGDLDVNVLAPETKAA